MFRIIVVLATLLTSAPATSILHGDINNNGQITIDEILKVINGAFYNCGEGCYDACFFPQNPCPCTYACEEFLEIQSSLCNDSDDQLNACLDLMVQP